MGYENQNFVFKPACREDFEAVLRRIDVMYTTFRNIHNKFDINKPEETFNRVEKNFKNNDEAIDKYADEYYK